MKRLLLLCVLSFALPRVYAQIENPVHWSYGAKRLSNTEVMVFLKADIDDGWHIYSTRQREGGPVKTSFMFSAPVAGSIAEPAPVTRHEDAFHMDVHYFEHQVIFKQQIKVSGAATIKGSVNFMVCNNQKCLPPSTVEFAIPVK